MKPRRAVITLLLVVFSVAAVFLLYDGTTTGDYVLVAAVLAAYLFVLMLEVSLSLRAKQLPKETPRGRKVGDAFQFASGCKQVIPTVIYGA